jgi:O-antigen/teichoic acid export membrane protein
MWRDNSGPSALLQNILLAVRKRSDLYWALTDQSVISGANFLTSILLARILGIDEFGRYTLAWSVVLFTQAIQSSAITAALLSLGPKYDGKSAGSYYGALFTQQAIFGLTSAILAGFGVMFLATMFPSWQLDGIAMPLAASVMFCQAQDFLRRYFFAIGRPHFSLLVDVVRYVAQILVPIVFIVVGFGITGGTALWIMAGTAGLASLAVVPFVERLMWSLSVFRTIGTHQWHFSKWLVASALLQWMIGNFMLFIAGVLMGPAAAGATRAAYTIVGATNIFFLGLENIVPTRASQRYSRGGLNELNAYLMRVAGYGGTVTMLIAGAFAAIPEFWLDLLFGEEFRGYGYLVRWFAICQVVIFLGLPIRAWLRTVENTKWIFYSNIVSTGLSVAAAYPLIANCGLQGIGIGAFAASLASVVIGLYGIKIDIAHDRTMRLS